MNNFIKIVLIIFLSGCGKLSDIKNEDVELMPEKVALSILKKHGAQKWAENPFLHDIGSFCGSEKEYVKFDQIEKATYLIAFRKLQLSINKWPRFCSRIIYDFDNVTESDAIEISNAVRSLGSIKIDKVYWAY